MPLSSDAADLMPVAAALAELNDGELCGLIAAINRETQGAIGGVGCQL